MVSVVASQYLEILIIYNSTDPVGLTLSIKLVTLDAY